MPAIVKEDRPREEVWKEKKKKKRKKKKERKNIWQTETDDETRHLGNDAFLANEARWAN